MTVAVETPEGVKTGSAVREVIVKGFRKRFGEGKGKDGWGNDFLKGEAVVVDLGERGQVFALLRGYSSGVDHWRTVVFKAFPCPAKGAMTTPCLNYYSNLAPAGPVTLTPDEYPVFVRFRDPTDPKSVELLREMEVCPGTRGYPQKFCIKTDRFAEAFGEGVKLKSVTIEMTAEPVNRQSGKFIPSYNKDVDGFMAWFNSLPYNDPHKIGPDSFGSLGEK